jgi:hypothetical protein
MPLVGGTLALSPPPQADNRIDVNAAALAAARTRGILKFCLQCVRRSMPMDRDRNVPSRRHGADRA